MANNRKKALRFWNGRGHGKYDKHHINVAAFSVAQACRMIGEACGMPGRITAGEIRGYYSEAWGNDMSRINAEEPCLYVVKKYSNEPPIKIDVMI